MGREYDKAVLADSPLFYFRLDEGADATALDKSGNGRVATYQGSPTKAIPLGIGNEKGVRLDGSAGYLTIPDEAAFDFAGTAAFSYEIWFRPASTPVGFKRLFSHENTGNTSGYLMYRSSNGKAQLERYAGGVCAGPVLDAGRLYHLVFTYDGANEKVYVDGVLGATTADVGVVVAVTDQLAIGRHSANASDFLPGEIARASGYSTALSPARIAEHYRTGIIPDAFAASTLHVPRRGLRDWESLVGGFDVMSLFTRSSTAKPFNLTEWPNPVRIADFARLRGSVQQMNLSLFVLFVQRTATAIRRNIVDVRASIMAQEWVRGSLLETVLAPSGDPFSLLSWPNPTLAPDFGRLRGWIDTFKSTLIGQDRLPFGLSDWPNPLRYIPAIGLKTWVDPLKQWLTGLDILPFRLSDWPNPLHVVDLGQLRGWIDTFKRTLIGQDALPFGLSDWPNPLRPIHITDLKTWLQNLAQTTLAPIAYPFSLIDWPNPSRYIPAISLKTWLDSFKLQLTGQDFLPFDLSDWPNPIITPLRPIRGWIDWFKLQLVGADFLPFDLSDWPNPVITPLRPIRGWLDSFKLQLIGQDVLPFDLTDWPNPLRVLDLGRLRGWIDTFKLPLIGQDRLPFSLSEWPNPVRVLDFGRLRGWLDSFKLQLIGQDALPFNLEDWPNPLRYIQAIDLKTWLVNLQQTTLLVTAVPFAFYNWIVPQGYLFSVYFRTWLERYRLFGQDVLPFDQTDWPNPQPPKEAKPRGFSDALKFWLFGQDRLPFRLSEWPNPTLKLPDLGLRTHLWNPLIQLLTVFIQSPFAFYDWVVPKGYIFAMALRTWTERYRLFGQDVLPFKLTDWPNPLLPLRPVRGWLDALKFWLFGQDALPFSLDDWPNPLKIVDFARLRGFVDWFKLQLIGQDRLPFSLSEWPNPIILPLRPVRGWLDALKFWLFGQDRLPFSLSEWPNPVRVLDFGRLRGWLDSFKLQLIGQDTLPFDLADWPNPLRALDFGRLRGWTDSFKLQLFGQDRLPFRLSEWPNPLRRLPLLQQWLISTRIFTLVVQPFAMLDWPNPRLRIPDVSLRTWAVSLVTRFVGLDVLPFRMSDWPNPILRRSQTFSLGIINSIIRILQRLYPLRSLTAYYAAIFSVVGAASVFTDKMECQTVYGAQPGGGAHFGSTTSYRSLLGGVG